MLSQFSWRFLIQGLGKVAEIEASFSADESLSGSLQKLFPPWERVRSAYFRQKDLLKKAAVAAELEDEAYQAAEGDGDMGRYEEIIGNVDERFCFYFFIISLFF